MKIPEKLSFGGSRKPLKFSNKERDFFKYEFNEICIFDCYNILQLKKMVKEVNTIVDIGANQGLFLVAARKSFPSASIHCYEPNPNIIPGLVYNGQSLNAVVHKEAVTRNDCKVSILFGQTDLHSTTMLNSDGEVVGSAFRKVIERVGGHIDILKMDCEGAEWDLLEDIESWSGVKSISMEYHLWAKPGSTVKLLFEKLNSMGFSVLEHSALDESFGLLTAIKH